jgi:hypothetical protein
MIRSLAILMSIGTVARAAPPPPDVEHIEQLTGKKGRLDLIEGVFKITAPRTDLKVTAYGVKLTPAMGLTSWVSFTKNGTRTMMMGDLCLTEDQVNPVMSVALDTGLEVTALHNHFFDDSPKIVFMHIGGMGDEARIAGAVGKVLAEIDRTAGKSRHPRPEIDPAKTSLDPKPIEAIMGHQGEQIDGVFKITIGRGTTMSRHSVGKTMGINTWAAFAGSNDWAIVDGDFAVLESELQPVLKALRGNAIDVVAIHQHMTGEQPRMMFLHYWGMGTTIELARALKAALDRTSR